jgi:hypothetical protein
MLTNLSDEDGRGADGSMGNHSVWRARRLIVVGVETRSCRQVRCAPVRGHLSGKC